MNSRITIINNFDGTADIMLDGESVENVPLTNNLDDNIHAVQWYYDKGEAEYTDHNEDITDFSPYNKFMTDRQEELDRITQESLDNEPSEEEKDRKERDDLLASTDWIVIKHMEINKEIPTEWVEYRQALRDITLQSGFPGNVDWPVKPTTTV